MSQVNTDTQRVSRIERERESDAHRQIRQTGAMLRSRGTICLPSQSSPPLIRVHGIAITPDACFPSLAACLL